MSVLASPTFNEGIVVKKNTTLGTDSTSALIVNATPTFANGLTVSAGTVSFPAASIPSTCISGGSGVSLSTANTWTAKQTLNAGIGLPNTTMTSPTVNMIGYTILSAGNYSNLSSGTIINNGANNFGTINLDPVGSVWIVSLRIMIYASGTVSSYSYAIKQGTQYTTSSVEILKNGKYTSHYIVEDTLTGVIQVDDSHRNICAGFTGTSSVYWNKYLTYFAATRIA